MLTIRFYAAFKKDYKRIVKRGYDICKLDKVIDFLMNEQPLPKTYNDHQLIGDYTGFRECHIAPDWLLIYEIDNDELLLLLTRTGTHSDLF